MGGTILADGDFGNCAASDGGIGIDDGTEIDERLGNGGWIGIDDGISTDDETGTDDENCTDD